MTERALIEQGLLIDGVCLTGQVLLAAQRRAALEEVDRAVPGAVVDSVVVLAESDAGQGWARPAASVADVRAAPGGDLATQLAAGDPPARLLWRHEADWAVELADGTVGWARAGDLALLLDLGLMIVIFAGVTRACRMITRVAATR